MATKAPAKKAATKATAKKAAAKAPKKPAPKPPKSPPRKPGGKGSPVTFTVRVGEGSLTMEYDGGDPNEFDMVLFVKDEEEARRVKDCIEEMGLRRLVVGIAKAYRAP